MSTQQPPNHSPEERNGSTNAAHASARYVCFGAFHVDLKKEELFKDGIRLKLQGKVYQALLALLGKPGEIVTREELRVQLWPSDTHVNYDANMNTTMNKLRQVLGDLPDQPEFVNTIPRKGYIFVAKVEFVDQPVPPQPRPDELSLRATPLAAPLITIDERAEGQASFFRTTILSQWFAAGVVVLVIASMLFGAALVLYAHR